MLVSGGNHADHRGTLCFVNEFNFLNVKRFYTITHHDISVIRAWQGHQHEVKHFFVTTGAFLIGWVKLDDWRNPSTELTVERQILRASEPAVLTINGGNANGFKALEKGSTLMVFSSMDLEASSHDTYRFAEHTWKL